MEVAHKFKTVGILCLIYFLHGCATGSLKQYTGYSSLNYFDRATIVNNRISQITETITDAKRVDGKNAEDSACITMDYNFDRKGNLIQYYTGNGSPVYYKYDEDGNFYDYGWVDGQFGKPISLSDNSDDEEQNKRNMINEEKWVQHVAEFKVNYRSIELYKIVNSCFSLYAVYEIQHEEAGDIPKEGVARWRKELKIKFPRLKKGHKSTDKLYIYYDYIFYDQ